MNYPCKKLFFTAYVLGSLRLSKHKAKAKKNITRKPYNRKVTKLKSKFSRPENFYGVNPQEEQLSMLTCC